MRVPLLACLALLALPASASAQDGIFSVGLGDGQHIVRQSEVPVTFSGGLAVDFHSDEATCAASGRCGLSGTVSWRPARSGRLYLLETRGPKGRHVDAYVFDLSFGLESGGSLRTTARVRREGGGLCADGNSESGAFEFAGGNAGSVVFGLAPSIAPPALLATSCAGPLLADLRGALPQKKVAVATLRRGRTTIDLHSAGPFTAAGLTGTATSDIVMHLGKGRVEKQPKPPSGVRQVRNRSIENEFRIARLTGGVGVDIHGAGDPAVCGTLDSCGLAGTETLSPAPKGGTFSLYAFAPASRSLRQLRAAVGLEPGGRPRGIAVAGSGLFEDRGTIAETIGLPGRPACADRVPLAAGALLLGVSGRRVTVSYAPYAEGTAPLRTRCAGPALEGPLASATVPLRRFSQRTVTLRLQGGVNVRSDGYVARTNGGLTVVLRHSRTRVSGFRQPEAPG